MKNSAETYNKVTNDAIFVPHMVKCALFKQRFCERLTAVKGIFFQVAP